VAPQRPPAPTITVMNQQVAYTVCMGDLDECAANGPRPAALPSYGPEDGGEISLCAVCLDRVTEMLDSLLATDNWRAIPSPSSPN
jgi:hypothetical protein